MHGDDVDNKRAVVFGFRTVLGMVRERADGGVD